MNTKASVMSLIATFVATLGLAPLATAGTVTNHPASICQPNSSSANQTLEYRLNAVTRRDSGRGFVDCPLVRRTVRTAGAVAYVDVDHAGSQFTTCVLYSFGRDGGTIASVAGTWTGSGKGRIKLPLAGSGKSTAWSDYVVSCYIPGSNASKVISIDLDER